MENEYKVNPELVDKVREFIMLRFSLKLIDKDRAAFLDEFGGMPELTDADATLRKMFTRMNDAHDFVYSYIDEFGHLKDYVMSLLDNEEAGPIEVLAFLDKFDPDYTSKN